MHAEVPAIQCVCITFGVDSSSRFLLERGHPIHNCHWSPNCKHPLPPVYLTNSIDADRPARHVASRPVAHRAVHRAGRWVWSTGDCRRSTVVGSLSVSRRRQVLSITSWWLWLVLRRFTCCGHILKVVWTTFQKKVPLFLHNFHKCSAEDIEGNQYAKNLIDVCRRFDVTVAYDRQTDTQTHAHSWYAR